MIKTKKMKNFRWLIRQALRYRIKLLSSFILASISALLALVPMLCIYFVAREYFETGDIDKNHTMLLAGIAAGAVILRFSVYMGAMICSHICAFDVLYDLRTSLATHLARLPMGFFDNRSSGEIKKIMGEDVENVETFLAHYLPDMVSAIILPAASVVLLLSINVELTVAALLPLSLAAVMHVNMSRIYHHNVGPFHDNMETMNASIVEYIRGMPVIKAFNKTTHSFGRYKATLQRHLEISEDWGNKASGYASLFWVSLDLGLVCILPVGFILYNCGRIDGAEFILFLLLGPGVMEPLGRIVMISGQLDKTGEGISRIQEILHTLPLREPKTTGYPIDYSITFEKVCFGYNDAEDTLHDLSFHVPEGSLTGLIGPSGAGKSTIASLVARFWDVRKGRILMGGVDIRDISMHALMQNIAFVFQDVYLMNETIMENIRMGKPATSDEEVMIAARSAAAHGFINKLERGYHTMVGEGGAHLSGGEKQRISIARAILKDAPILILDEVTSATDPENEGHIYAALNALIPGKTVMVIAHKLPSVMHADQLLLFHEGTLCMNGTHKELLQNELYRSLWEGCTSAGGWKLSAEGE